ncbi:MAG: 5,6-dimethylbenzimidazole synthase, partial [Polyangiaceae bacterium]|nr:5,6-dimethylbenzimidazole synthase [Polyangiaceae bacterium]
MSEHAASPHAFSADARAALYEIMRKRRDIREFAVGAVVPEPVLLRLLEAAHLAPSVGFSQPWGFVLVRDEARRARIRESFLRCRQAEAARFAEPRRTQYLGYRLEGIAESSLNLCVTVDLRGDGEHVLGTTAQPDAVRASVLCAVQNLWLAARAEGIAVGWVSIVEPEILRTELALPAGVEAVAYLCVGLPKEPFRERPLLEETAWRDRVNLAERVHREQWPANASTCDSQEAPAVAEASSVEISENARRASAQHQATLVKPEGSLGKLETLAGWVAAAHGVFPAVATGPLRTGLVVFAADHGVVAEGVSAYGSTLTAQMLATMA